MFHIVSPFILIGSVKKGKEHLPKHFERASLFPFRSSFFYSFLTPPFHLF